MSNEYQSMDSQLLERAYKRMQVIVPRIIQLDPHSPEAYELQEELQVLDKSITGAKERVLAAAGWHARLVNALIMGFFHLTAPFIRFSHRLYHFALRFM